MARNIPKAIHQNRKNLTILQSLIFQRNIAPKLNLEHFVDWKTANALTT
jgi:hypothetical protein